MGGPEVGAAREPPNRPRGAPHRVRAGRWWLAADEGIGAARGPLGNIHGITSQIFESELKNIDSFYNMSCASSIDLLVSCSLFSFSASLCAFPII